MLTCDKGMIITKSFYFKNKDKDNNFYFKKNYAYYQNICNKIFKRWKMLCVNEDHDKELGEENIRLKSVQNIMDCQYLCTNHYVKYGYYCQIYKINIWIIISNALS